MRGTVFLDGFQQGIDPFLRGFLRMKTLELFGHSFHFFEVVPAERACCAPFARPGEVIPKVSRVWPESQDASVEEHLVPCSAVVKLVILALCDSAVPARSTPSERRSETGTRTNLRCSRRSGIFFSPPGKCSKAGAAWPAGSMRPG